MLLFVFQGILDKIPKVTHIIVMSDGQNFSKAGFPSHLNVLSFAEVELRGAMPDNSEFHIETMCFG